MVSCEASLRQCGSGARTAGGFLSPTFPVRRGCMPFRNSAIIQNYPPCRRSANRAKSLSTFSLVRGLDRNKSIAVAFASPSHAQEFPVGHGRMQRNHSTLCLGLRPKGSRNVQAGHIRKDQVAQNNFRPEHGCCSQCFLTRRDYPRRPFRELQRISAMTSAISGLSSMSNNRTGGWMFINVQITIQVTTPGNL